MQTGSRGRGHTDMPECTRNHRGPLRKIPPDNRALGGLVPGRGAAFPHNIQAGKDFGCQDCPRRDAMADRMHCQRFDHVYNRSRARARMLLGQTEMTRGNGTALRSGRHWSVRNPLCRVLFQSVQRAGDLIEVEASGRSVENLKIGAALFVKLLVGACFHKMSFF